MTTAGTFLITAEDVDGEIILFHDSFVLRQRYAEDGHGMTLISLCLSPFHRLLHLCHLGPLAHAETRLPVSFKQSHPSRNSLPLPFGLQASQRCITKNLKAYTFNDPNIQQNSETGFPGLVHVGRECIHSVLQLVVVRLFVPSYALPRLWANGEQPIFQTSSQPLDSKNDDIR